MTSCGYAGVDNRNAIIIHTINCYDKGYCVYYGEGSKSAFGGFDFQIIDSCGKYNISDTIKLIK